MSLNWQHIDTAPRDGTPIWAWLNDQGIKRLQWLSPEEIAAFEGDGDPEDYDGQWVEVGDNSEDWEPKYWLPDGAIPRPA